MAHERKLLKRYMRDATQIFEDEIHVILDAFEMWLRQDCITVDDWEAVEIVWSIIRNTSKKIISFDASLEHSAQLLKIFDFCMKRDLVGKGSLKTHLTLHGQIIKEILMDFLHPNHCKPDVVSGFLSHSFVLMKSDLPHICHSASSFVYALNAYPGLLVPYIDHILECYLTHHQYNLAACLTALFPSCEDQILMNIAEISRNIDDFEPMEKHHVFRLYETIAKKYPQKILPFFKFLVSDFNDSLVSSASLPCLVILSNHYPDMFMELIDKLSMIVERQPYHVGYVDKIFTNVAILNDKEARRILTNCLVQFKAVDESYYPAIFTCIKEIGVKYPKVLTNYSSAIQALGSTNGTQNYVQFLMNYLDGTSPEPDFFQIKENCKPSTTSIKQSTTPALQTQPKSQNNKTTSTVKPAMEMQQKVQSKDSKPDKTSQGVVTAPEWCNKLSSLLNVASDNDWRYLALYLGYPSDTIQLLSQKDNPSLSMFNDWYTSHKGREATYAIYMALKMIGRKDCMEMIDSSIPKKDKLIPEKFTKEEEKPISVCLSYHRDNHVDVNVLKFHLELAGFHCWMETGPLLHIDKLYKKVDESMRGSDVVLCMCSNVYVHSRTCGKQVNLAHQLNKPIIPVVIGPLSWPPAGPMSSIYSQLECVQLYQFSADNHQGRKYWPKLHFVELLAKICYHTSPDVEKISKEEYKNWIPTLENFPENGLLNLREFFFTKRDTVTAVDVFISYQWNQIEESMVLYSVLNQLGFTCWLDVLNLGANPIINQVDKVIRSAKVMISLVTPKYTRSANCCREVTLATVLKLPIIPLVMEKMFWPPRGPVSTFTQLPYIDFTSEESTVLFRGARLKQLYEHLKEFVPAKSKVSCNESLFTEKTDFDLPSDISDDFESTDDLDECGSANVEVVEESCADNIAMNVDKNSIRTANGDKLEKQLPGKPGAETATKNNHVDVQYDPKVETVTANQEQPSIALEERTEQTNIQTNNCEIERQSESRNDSTFTNKEQNDSSERKLSNGVTHVNIENNKNHVTNDDEPPIVTVEITNKEDVTKPGLEKENDKHFERDNSTEIPLKPVVYDGKKSGVCILL